MDDHIVVSVHPFKLYQEVMVFKGQECIDTVEVPLDEINQAIQKMAIKYNVTNVDLSGDRIFTSRIQEELSDLSKFNKFLNITVY